MSEASFGLSKTVPASSVLYLIGQQLTEMLYLLGRYEQAQLSESFLDDTATVHSDLQQIDTILQVLTDASALLTALARELPDTALVDTWPLRSVVVLERFDEVLTKTCGNDLPASKPSIELF